MALVDSLCTHDDTGHYTRVLNFTHHSSGERREEEKTHKTRTVTSTYKIVAKVQQSGFLS